MRTTAVALACCLLIAALVGVATVSGTPSSPSPAASEASTDVVTLQSQSEDEQRSPESIEITVQSDGDARFVLAREFPTETDAQQDAFDRLAAEFENGDQGDLGYSTYAAVVDDVANETGRDMELTEAGAYTTRSGDVGRLEYRFTWTNFATTEDERVTVGDAFATGEGLWLGELGTGQRLVIRAPDGYSLSESPSGPEIDNDALIWTGPEAFTSGDLRIVFEESPGESPFPSTMALLLIGFVAAGVALVVGWQVASRRTGDRSIGDRVLALVATTESESGSNDSGPSPNEGGAVPTQAPDDEGAASVAGAATSADAHAEDEEGDPDAIDPELFSDEERVEHLLEANGGRMKQANIVTETGWSNAKVSQLLSHMAEEDRVDKLRIGRENLITLPDVDVTDQE